MNPEAVLSILNLAQLPRLGLLAEDEHACRELITTLPQHPERLSRVVALSDQLLTRIGHFFDDDLPVRDNDGLTSFEDGLVTLLALIAVSEPVHDFLVSRGLPSELAWGTLADLGQQARVSRQVFGSFGLCTQAWCVANWTGRQLWPGRLQFTLERDDDGGCFVGVHIPETGPLTPEAVDASLSRARELFPRIFPEHPAPEFRLTSWLLDPLIVEQLHPESNIARFARRFELTDAGEADPHDALFFVFHLEPALQPVDLSALPGDSSLRRAVRRIPPDQLRVPTGRLVNVN